MLHERTDEAMRCFDDGRECAFFDDIDDLIEKIERYLVRDEERQAIAAAGRRRILNSGCSYDDRVESITAKCRELLALKVHR